ncbi:MAG: flagellar hook-basal body protein [Candidatus Gastranaerophilaceae bacterium]
MILRGFESASNGMLALMDNLDNTANNLANVNTTGYKKSMLTFKNVMDASVYQKNGELIKGQSAGSNRYLGQLSMGSETMKLTYDFTQGALSKTGVPYDMAIQGDGFFKLQDRDGNISYTRNGSFCQNSQGFLTTKEGEYVLDNVNRRIRLFNDEMEENQRDTYQILVTEQGNIEAYDGRNRIPLATLGIFNFSNKDELISNGFSKFATRTDEAQELETPATKFTIQQGMLEMSNSNVIKEMINTIQTSRNYESLSKVITENSTLLDSAISVGRIRG